MQRSAGRCHLLVRSPHDTLFPRLPYMPVSVDNGGMRARFLAIAAAVWTAANAGIYLLIISAQGNSPEWWYLAVLGTSALLFVLAAGRVWPVPLLITGAVLLTAATLIGVLSIGPLLVPGVLAAVAALGSTRRQGGRPPASRPRERMPTG